VKLFELGAAVGLGKRVVPIVPREFQSSEPPYPLRSRQGIVRGTPQETAKKLAIAAQSESLADQEPKERSNVVR